MLTVAIVFVPLDIFAHFVVKLFLQEVKEVFDKHEVVWLAYNIVVIMRHVVEKRAEFAFEN